MKTNTLKVLMSTASRDLQIRPVPVDLIKRLVLTDLSDAGVRSLINLMKRSGLLQIQATNKQTMVFATGLAWTQLKQAIPALMEEWEAWPGDWSCVMFLSPPKSDRQFRYLRSFCLRHHFMPLMRGVYLAPTWYLNAKLVDLEGSYRRSIGVMKIEDFGTGEVLDRIMVGYDIMGLSELYSGISKRLDELLDIFQLQKRLTKPQIEQAAAEFSRLFTVVSQDLGLIRYLVPTGFSASDLVEQWQLLMMNLAKSRYGL